MRNIVEYLWQTDESLPILLGGSLFYVCCHNFLVHEDKQTLKWYFYSKKQHKILKKKPQNTSVEQIIAHIEQNRRNQLAGLYITTKDTLIQKKIINNAELIELLYGAKNRYLVVDLSMLSKVFAYNVTYNCSNVIIESTVVDGIQDIIQKATADQKNRQEQIVRAGVLIMVEQLESKLTVGKSTVKQLQLTVLVDCLSDSREPLIVLWSDRLIFSNDYYKLSFDYNGTKVAISEVVKKQIELGQADQWVCDGCKQKKYDKESLEVDQETAEKIRTHLNITKYGLTSRGSFTICRNCTDLVRSL